ncbi:unnamed protein product [marine sediment metagenome]|uniref:Uncharacterized protein n=1 Tax=marine sediment metagenome TaxID=412755 RepID=X1B326_9ZZZZ
MCKDPEQYRYLGKIVNYETNFNPDNIIDSDSVNYGRAKVCRWEGCSTVLNHYRAKKTNYCSACDFRAMQREDKKIERALKRKKKRENNRDREKRKQQKERESK